jgi:hypothetical protein
MPPRRLFILTRGIQIRGPGNTYTPNEICGLGSRIGDVEAFWSKTEIKIIYFVPLSLIVLIVSDCMVYPDPKV